MRVTLYGRLADLLGRDLEVAVDTPCTVAALRSRMIETWPHMAQPLGDRRVRACVGNKLVPDDHPLDGTDDVEFLAPVSGG